VHHTRIIIQDKRILDFCRTVQEAGYEVYVVGGAARDLVLGRQPSDWDFTTDATPQQIVKIFPKVIPTGIKHGTVTVLFKGTQYEITTYRADGSYSDHRRPDSVAYTTDLKEDLKRRDFTINALAFDPLEDRFVDEHGGLKDIKGRLIRCIGDATERFNEDALRILRAPRFASKLGFDLEEKTLEAMRNLAPDLRFVSPERIREELLKLLGGRDVKKGLAYLREGDLPQYLYPELGFIPQGEALGEGIQVYGHKYPTMALASFFYPLSSNLLLAEKVLKRGKFSNREQKLIFMFWRLLRIDWQGDPGILPAKSLLWELRQAKLAAQAILPSLVHFYRSLGLAAPSQRALNKLKEYEREPLELPELACKGDDLVSWGVPKNQELGDCLKSLLTHVWSHPQDNQKDILEALIKNRGIHPLPDYRLYMN
jgi:tRNA nucleotidyltransferase (CCA-adding enzyme)